MSASVAAKKAGLKSLSQVIELSGVPRSTLIDWHRDRPRLFKIVLFGCQKVIEGEKE